MVKEAIDQAFILGAGLGKRMHPLTETCPKPLVKLAGKPLIDHVIKRLSSVGVEKIVVNVHYLADQLEAHLNQVSNPVIIPSSERSELLDTGGGAAKALEYFGDKPFFIHNSDSVWLEGDEDNLARMIAEFDRVKMDALLLLADRTGSLGYNGKGDFKISKDGRLIRRQADETADCVFAGVSIAHPRLFEAHPKGPFSLNLLWDRAMQEGRIYGIKHHGIWMHVGTSEALDDAEHCIKQSTLTL